MDALVSILNSVPLLLEPDPVGEGGAGFQGQSARE